MTEQKDQQPTVGLANPRRTRLSSAPVAREVRVRSEQRH